MATTEKRKVNIDWQVSNCCQAEFLDENDICWICGEHADIAEVIIQLPYPYRRYEISSYGVLKKDGRIISPSNSRSGYSIWNFSAKGWRRYAILSHRLVALLFVPNPLNLQIVEHIDDDKKNIKANNLKWSTHLDNNRKANEKRRKPNPNLRVFEGF